MNTEHEITFEAVSEEELEEVVGGDGTLTLAGKDLLGILA